MRDYDDELLSVARLKKGADDRIIRRIDSSINAVRLVYALLAGMLALALWLTDMRRDVTNQEKEINHLKELLNQVYEREFGVKITFR